MGASTETFRFQGFDSASLAAFFWLRAEPLVVTPAWMPFSWQNIIRSRNPGLMNGSPPLKLIENVPTNSLMLRSAFCHSSIDISSLYLGSRQYSQ